MVEDSERMATEKVCALCGCEHELQDSHLLPKHFYKYIDMMKRRGTKVQFKDNKGILTNLRRQITQYLLGAKCEQRFSTRGEDYFSRLIHPKPGEVPAIFRHLKDLKHSNLYGSEVSNLDAGKLYYFALSIVWRAAQQGWPSYTSISLPAEDLEYIKQYLLSDGEPRFPPSYCVEISLSLAQSDIWTASFPQTTAHGNVFFNFANVEFHVIKNPVLFEVYSNPNQGGVPIFFRQNHLRSKRFASSQMKGYEKAVPTRKVIRLGQSPANHTLP
ncbi:hypothetical protein NLO88_18045 [Pseudomonas syringae]|nr:hypothetical protein [Pseudomonas syringae]